MNGTGAPPPWIGAPPPMLRSPRCAIRPMLRADSADASDELVESPWHSCFRWTVTTQRKHTSGLRKTKESKEERDQWDPLFGAVDPRPSREKAGFCRVVAQS